MKQDSITKSLDNLYRVGTLISAKANPVLQLVIESYCQRIYYCRSVAEPDRRHIAYYERELIPPALPLVDNTIPEKR